jgi:hypothetical protein
VAFPQFDVDKKLVQASEQQTVIDLGRLTVCSFEMNSFSFQYSVLDTSVLHVCDGKLMNDGVCWICKVGCGIALI